MYRNTRHWDGESLLEETLRDVTWDEVRRARDKALSDSDWRALKDVTLSVPWRDYRQALRDITEHPDANTACDNWPEAPE